METIAEQHPASAFRGTAYETLFFDQLKLEDDHPIAVVTELHEGSPRHVCALAQNFGQSFEIAAEEAKRQLMAFVAEAGK